MIKELWLDLETYSETPIKNGTYRYAEDSEIMLFLYALDDGPAACWDLTTGDSMPEDLEYAIFETDCEVTGHNTMFDRNVMRYNGVEITQERWVDTMLQAYEHALPGALSKLGVVLNLADNEQKDGRGKALINLFCKPRPKNMKLRRATRLTHPKEWQEFIEYGLMDIVSMRAAAKAMPNYNYPRGVELDHWHLDQRINDRGFCVDLDLVNAAITAVKDEKIELKRLAFELTEGEVTSTTKRDEMLRYILEYHGIQLPDLTKSTLERRLNDPDIPRPVRELIAIRLQATASSTSKYTALLKAVNDDGRCRGTIQFCGAKRTGRAAGRTFQPQNLPSRGLLEEWEVEFGIDALKAGCSRDFFDNTMKLLSSCVRGVLQAAPGHKLCVSDLSNIEGRLGAWLSGEAWKIQAFRDFDAKTGPDLYNLAYANSFRVDVAGVTKKQRSIGKVQELMLQYQGGVGAFVTGALGYGFDLEVLAKEIWDTLPEGAVKEANKFYAFVLKKKMSTFGLSKEAFIASDVLKRLWRESNSMIVKMWDSLDVAVRLAIPHPGEIYEAGEFIKIRRDKNWLRIRLPSGRFLCYPSPRIDEKGNISYMGENPYTRQWSRVKAYAGKFFENICQAVARDILYNAMPLAEEAGFPIVLHVHDELVTEPLDKKELTVDNLSDIMAAPVAWAPGLPLAAAGFEDYRYRK